MPAVIFEIVHRHADFQGVKRMILFLFINQLPERPLLDLHHCAQRCTADSRKPNALHQVVYRAMGLFNRGFGHGIG
jgi:hypothetical protein